MRNPGVALNGFSRRTGNVLAHFVASFAVVLVLGADALAQPRPHPAQVDRPSPEAQPDGQDPFDMARQVQQEREEEGQAAAGEPSENGPDPAPSVKRPSSAEPARNAPRETDQLLAFLTPDEGSTVRPDIRVRLGDAPVVKFTSCKPVPGNNLRKQFGEPDKMYDLRGELPVGREGRRQAIRWEMWVYGQAKLFVDETGMIRYRQVR